MFWDTGDRDEFASPLSNYIGIDRAGANSGLTTLLQERDGLAEENAQRMIAQCMAESGFEYATAGQRTEATREDQPADSREWAEIYGFGITTLAFSQQQVGQHLVGYQDNSATSPESAASTAAAAAAEENLAIFEQLDEGEKPRYLEALRGDPRVPDVASAEMYTAEPNATGCIAVIQQIAAVQSAFYSQFGDRLDDLQANVAADPRIAEHNSLVATCVTSKGLRYTESDQLYQRWSAELQAIQGSLDFGAVAGSGTKPQFSAESKARLITIQNEETELATAMYDCGADPTTTNALYASVAHDLEEEFIDRHRAELDSFKDAHGR